MVSPHRLSVTKDWPEYKNIISFLKRRTQTWFNGKKKKILQCLKRVLGDEEKKKTRNRALSESLRQIKKS